MQEAEKSGLTEKVDESITVGDSSFIITDVIYDGSRISLGYLAKNVDSHFFDHFNKDGNISFRIDKKDVLNYSAEGTGEQLNDSDFAGLINLYLQDEPQKDSFDFSFILRQLMGKQATGK